jgi:hypothetical protein
MKRDLFFRIFKAAIPVVLISIYQLGNSQCTFTGLNPVYCVNSASSALSSTNAGGYFSGPGIIPPGATFDPSVAGSGTHVISYNLCASNYSITTGNYSPAISTTVGTDAGNGDDNVLGPFNVGFTFKFFCTNYTQFYISTNGYIMFSNGGAGCCTGGNLPNNTTPNNLIAFAWTDLYVSSPGIITYTTIGTAPFRKLIVSFDNVN